MVALNEQGNWNLPLNRPIEIEHDHQRLETLGDVGAFILALPEKVKRQELWHAAAEAVLEAARSGHSARDPIVFRMAAIMSGENIRAVRE
jgi:hypothetical protein